MASTSATGPLLGFFDDLVRCETRLYNALGDALQAEHGIVTSQFEFLRHLRDHPESRVADIATNFAAGIGSISKMVDRLEAQGWAMRVPNPTDKRSSLISLTRNGATLLAAAEKTFRAELAALVSPALDADAIAAAAAALTALRASLERDRVGIPVG